MKKSLSIIAVILTVFIVFSSASTGTLSSAAYQLGDADKNGTIELKDALWVVKYLLKETTRVIKTGDPADVNQNNAVDVDDLRQVKRYLAGLQKTFEPKGVTTATSQQTTTTTNQGTTHTNNEKPFNDGGVPRTYRDGIASLSVVNDCPYNSVLVNHLGYATNAKKIVKLTEGMENQPAVSLIGKVTVYLVDENTKEIVGTYESGRKTMSKPGKLFGTDDVWFSTVDISDFNTPGTYRIYAPAGYSRAFTIQDNPYNKAVDDLLMAMYYNRCGGEISDKALRDYDQYLADNYGMTAGSYYEKYQSYARDACHLESSGSNKGKEVVVVDTYKLKTAITYTYTSAPNTTNVNDLLDKTYPAIYGFDTSIDTTNKKIVVSVTDDDYLSETEIDNITTLLQNNFSGNKIEYSSVSKSETITANRDADGNVITYPATDFAYGLHDAGDYGRYTQPAAQVVSDLCYAYEMYPEVFEKLNVIQDTNSKGEKDDIPDILDHARWEAKFLLNMQNKDPNSSTYGGIYFKLCTKTFASATGSLPTADKSFNGENSTGYSTGEGFRAMSVNFATTAGAAGALASCAYAFKDIDPNFSKECQDAAQLAYDFYVNNRKDNPKNMTLDEKNARDIQPWNKCDSNWRTEGGSYSGTATEANDSQQFMYAALYRLTGNSSIHSRIKASSYYSTELGTHYHGGFGSLAYLLMDKKGEQITDSTVVDNIKSKFKSAADSLDSQTSSSSFGDLGTYGWGSNSGQACRLNSSAIAHYFGEKSSKYDTYIESPRSTLNFVLGVNLLANCFITGQSDGSTKNIHHWPSAILMSRYSAPCAPGWLAGGYVTGEGGPFRYYDKQSDYICNEICVYWNSPALISYGAVVQQDIDNSK